MADRTVLDVVDRTPIDSDVDGFVRPLTMRTLRALGVDPYMPADEFERALKIGLRVVRQSGTLKCGCPDKPMLMIRHERGCREVSQDDW